MCASQAKKNLKPLHALFLAQSVFIAVSVEEYNSLREIGWYCRKNESERLNSILLMSTMVIREFSISNILEK